MGTCPTNSSCTVTVYTRILPLSIAIAHGVSWLFIHLLGVVHLRRSLNLVKYLHTDQPLVLLTIFTVMNII